MWKYVNSKCICVKSLFISPIFDIIWRSDMVVKDRQQLLGLSQTCTGNSSEGAKILAFLRIVAQTLEHQLAQNFR
jgi:hypothetical protein